VGYLGWGAVRWFEPSVPARLGADPRFPDAELLLVDDLAAVDWARGSALLIANVEPSRFADTRSALRDAEERLDLLAAAFDERSGEAEATVGDEVDTWTGPGFEAAVESVLRHVRAGDCMQTVLSRRLTLPFSGDPLDLYERMRSASPVPYHFLVRVEDEQTPRRAVVGASPELLLRVTGGRVTVKPIAGTRPRGKTPEEDAAREAELRADPKERAEHVMLVDLGRNDVGRVATPGSVRVDEREAIHRFSHVMHMVSEVSGTLRDGLTCLDALAAAFPAGTVSGAPKVRAMQIIDAEEPVPRGPYGGAVGTVCYDGNLVMAIHLRSVALAGQELRLQAGAGIVSDSIPAQELAETEAKLASVRAALRWRRW
jgi:anthranilate synthase component 1